VNGRVFDHGFLDLVIQAGFQRRRVRDTGFDAIRQISKVLAQCLSQYSFAWT
jgi:uncharacterized membrane protein